MREREPMKCGQCGREIGDSMWRFVATGNVATKYEYGHASASEDVPVAAGVACSRGCLVDLVTSGGAR